MSKFEKATKVTELIVGVVYTLCQIRSRVSSPSEKVETQKKVTVESVKDVGVTAHVRVNDGENSRLLTLDKSGVGFHRRHYRKDIYWLEES
jgi:23S rRNA G2445 N2-methylase RlmL